MPRTVLPLVLLPTLAFAQGTPPADEPIQRIAFGSCVRQERPAPIWNTVVDSRPEVFLFIGDNIYGDTEDMRVMRDKYATLGAMTGFRSLRQTCPILATWDDHDFGVNDGGAEYPKRVQSQQEFLDFFGVPADSPRREREGVYSAGIYGPPGERVQLILLDTRYFRDKLLRARTDAEPGEGLSDGPYAPNDDPDATVLGDAQWQWLDDQLRKPAEVRVIASSIQVASEQHGWETWANFPRERQRLFELVGRTGAGGVVFVSGDRHLAEISAVQGSAAGYPQYDVTSSSLNQPSGGPSAAGERWRNERNRHRLGVPYFEVNFGMILIDWADDPLLRLQVRNLDGEVVLQDRVRLSTLQPR